MEITKIKVNGIVYDIADKEAVEALARQLAAEKQRAEEAERVLGNAVASAARVEQLEEVKTDVQANTTAINNEVARAKQAENDAAERGHQLALRSLFVAAGAEYNDTDNIIEKIAPWVDDNGNNYIVKHLPGCYFYNFIGDLTEEDMLYIIENDDIVYNLGRPRLRQTDGRLKTFKGVYHEQTVSSLSTNSYSQFLKCVNLEVAMFSRYVYVEELAICRLVCGTSHFFSGCSKLKFVSPMTVDNINGYTNVFQNCSSLIEVKLYGLKTNFTLQSSPLINKRSILCLIQKANPSSAITITLHPDAYTRLANDADIVAALSAQPLITLVSA